MNNSEQRTVLSDNPYLELKNHQEMIQFPLTRDQHLFGRDFQQADLVVPDTPDWGVISGCHALLRRQGTDYYIYDGNGGDRPSTNGLFCDRTRITVTQGYLLKNGTKLRIGQNPKNWVELTYINPASASVEIPTPETSISLANRSVLLGRDSTANLVLDSPIVSRRHATLEPDHQGHYILRDHSTNGVFVNSQKVANLTIVKSGDTIRIGPFTLILQGDQLRFLDRGHQIRLDADKLTREVRDEDCIKIMLNKVRYLALKILGLPKPTPLRNKTILNKVSLAIEPGQFVALVGGSGAGKSTLMKTLLGIDPTTSGKVFINGEELRSNFNIYRNQIGYVPQSDIIHKELTVTEVLTYAAKLRLPPDIDVNSVVEKTLNEIEMADDRIRRTVVSKLSGGQLKRVSIGVELLADPKLFFLDEPTSGLDPGLDKKMMQLLRKLADRGRTIILVTHATANVKLCDRIVFLGRGGYLCYFGNPDEATPFFKITSGDFADIYNELEQGEAQIQNWANTYHQSPYYQKYIGNYLSLNTQSHSGVHPKPQQVKPSPFKQLSILTQRYFQILLRDRVNLGLALLTAPVGIGLIPLAIRDKAPLVLGSEPDPTLAPLALRVLFVLTCAALWVGLSSSLQELVKEDAIYQRERLVNLGIIPYLGSKVLILSGLAVLQSLLMVAVILMGFKSPSSDLIPWGLGAGITSFLTLFSCMSLGLLVSALVKNGSQANNALPLILLPQIIFSGVLFKIEGVARVLSWLMLSRWSVGAYGALVNVNAMVPEAMTLPDGSILPQPFEPTAVYDPTWQNLSVNWQILLLQAGIYLGLTWWVQKRKDIF